MKRLIFLFIFSCLFISCDTLTGVNTVTQSQLETQLQEIRDFVSEGSCTAAGECSYLAIGSKPCGGPAAYIVFSNNIDVAELQKMVNRYTEDQKTYNKENNVMSDCSLVNPPAQLDCVDGNCVEIRR